MPTLIRPWSTDPRSFIAVLRIAMFVVSSISAVVLWMLGDLPVAFGQAAAAPRAHPLLIYLAGPFGFSEAGRDFMYRVLIPDLKREGFEVLDPWKLTDQGKIDPILQIPYGKARRDAWRKLNPEIARNNQMAIDRCDAVFAVLDGPDVDSGTAAEIGYAFAQHKPVVGYRGDLRLSSDNEGSIVNLQVEYFITESGGTIAMNLKDALKALTAVTERK
jgi:nucleoside 2-deoxyribosyltransferase